MVSPVRQGTLLARYLAGDPVDEEARDRYVRASEVLDLSPDGLSRTLWERIDRRPRLLPLVDAGLGLVHPDATLRTQILLMAALLEASPRHTDLYLARPRGPLHLLRLAWVGLAAVAKALVGVLVVRRARTAETGAAASADGSAPDAPPAAR